MRKPRLDHFYRDLLIVLFGLFATVLLVKAGVIEQLLSRAEEQAILGSFITGIFFTSVFTLGPASVILAELSEVLSPLTVALWGGLGAMFGDLILFLFIRDVFADDMRKFFKKHIRIKIASYFHFGFLKWLYPIIGALIIASPLPDEFGLALLGLARLKLVVVLPIFFVMNFLGILAIGLIAARI